MLPYSITLILYNIFLMYFVPYVTVTANRIHLGLSTDQTDQLNIYWTDFQAAFAAYLNPLTNGPVSTGTINGLYHVILPYVTAIQQQIKNNPTVILTIPEYI